MSDDVPELDFDLSTVSESEPETNFDDGPETYDEDDEDRSHDQHDDFESEYRRYDSGYEAEAELETDDEESDDDSEEQDQDSESDGEYLRALDRLIENLGRSIENLDRLIEKLDLLRLELAKYEARKAARTNTVNGVSRHSNVRPAYEGFVIDVSHLNVHNNAPRSATAAAAAVVVPLLAGQQNKLVRCAISFRWWLTGREHAEYSVPLVFYVLVCDCFAVLAAAALCATLRALARALLCSPGGIIIVRPLSGVPFVWLKHAPIVTAVSVALDAICADVCERVLRRRGCRAWAALPAFQLRRQWAGARRQFVIVSFTLFAVLSLVHVAICSFCITAAGEERESGRG